MMGHKEDYLNDLASIASALDNIFKKLWGETGFVLILMKPDAPEKCNVVTNQNEDISQEALKHAIKSFEEGSTGRIDIRDEGPIGNA